MADLSGRTDLAVGGIAELGGIVKEYEWEAAVTKGQAVYMSSAGKITPTTVAAEIAIGIATMTKAIGEMCPVCTQGKVKVTAGGAIAGRRARPISRATVARSLSKLVRKGFVKKESFGAKRAF